MRAAVYEAFRGPIAVTRVDDPAPPAGGAVLEVRATGLCRSDWHGWMGHDPDIRTPHVPGHEIAGVVAAVGTGVERVRVGERVTLPFVCGCGTCRHCVKGDHQVCDRQSQPGFTRWGSFAEYVAIDYADVNLVTLPESMDFVQAASLGCRFATAWRAVVAQGRVTEGDWLAVYGCGGVGLSAVLIGAAFGARVIGVDPGDGARDLARAAGAVAVIDPNDGDDVPARVRELSGGGADVSLDALGSRVTFEQSVACLAKRGRHIQVGLMTGDERAGAVALDAFIANELELLGSHGLQAHRYPEMLSMIASGAIDIGILQGPTVSLEAGARMLAQEAFALPPGVTVIDRLSA